MIFQKQPTMIVIGAGAAGLFAAIAAKERKPQAQVVILEKTSQVLSKLRLSGGGRCNVTHGLFDPKLLVQNYPRGSKELLGLFHVFQPKDTIQWFSDRQVTLKTEPDGRMFPVTDSSETIAHCLLNEAKRLGIEIKLKQNIQQIRAKNENNGFEIFFTQEQPPLTCDRLLLATGNSPQGYEWARSFGHTIVPPVPSLFTFNVPTSPLLDLSGITVPDAELKLDGIKWKQRGPLLLTHWGFSGPAALKLSAWAARDLHERQYTATLIVNWLPDFTESEAEKALLELKRVKPQSMIEQNSLFKLPTNLWKRLVQLSGMSEKVYLSGVPNSKLKALAQLCTGQPFQVEGKTIHKQEFVTCGGVSLKEIHFKHMESRVVKNLYFAGEIMDIDGVTGGFNFQNAWTTAWVAGNGIGEI